MAVTACEAFRPVWPRCTYCLCTWRSPALPNFCSCHRPLQRRLWEPCLWLDPYPCSGSHFSWRGKGSLAPALRRGRTPMTQTSLQCRKHHQRHSPRQNTWSLACRFLDMVTHLLYPSRVQPKGSDPLEDVDHQKGRSLA